MKGHIDYVLTFMEISEAISRVYKHSTPMFKLGDEDVMIADVLAAAVLSQTNTYLLGTKGEGKTLLAEIVQKSIMNDDALYLRGDRELDLKGLMIELNLDGKTEDEIYQVSKNLERPLFIIDELNRCIGLVQNQFLNIADGYIEIRGKKYYLGESGNEYSLMIATGNPPRNGDYTGVFDEDVALLDRMGLILNVDDYEMQEVDTADVKAARINKKKIPLGDMRKEVFAVSRSLGELSKVYGHYMEILSAYVYSRFLKMKVAGKELNKRQVEDWRSLIVPGSHAAGDVISQGSDISQRMVQEGTLSEALLLYLAGVKMAQGADAETAVTSQNLIDCYLETLMLNVRYDRRFLPFDYIRENHDGDISEFLKKVKTSLKGEIDAKTLEECAGMGINVKDAISNGDVGKVQGYIGYLNSLGSQPIALMSGRMFGQRLRNKFRKERRAEVKKKLVGLRRA